ncbi:canalicular multispecific organic anion transporter 1, partial [Biomphalaria glabrata]
FEEKNGTELTLLILKILFTTILFLLYCFPNYTVHRSKRDNPEVTASMLSWITFSWLDRLILKGFRSTLSDDEIFAINPRDQSESAVNKFLHYCNKETESEIMPKKKLSCRCWGRVFQLCACCRKHRKLETSILVNSIGVSAYQSIQETSFSEIGREASDPAKDVSLLRTMVKCYLLEALTCQWGTLMFVPSVVLSPVILGLLIDFISDQSEPTWHGYIYFLAFILLSALYTFIGTIAEYSTACFSVRVRSTLMAMIYRKVTTMSNEVKKIFISGEIMNLMSVDTGNVETMLDFSMWILINFFNICICGYLLYTVVGEAMLGGLVVILVVYALNVAAMKKLLEYQDQLMMMKDWRMKTTNEVLNGIKIIKLYAWENIFTKRLEEIRNQELQILLKYAILSCTDILWLIASFWMLYFIIIMYMNTSENNFLDANTAFLAMNYADIIMSSTDMISCVIGKFIICISSMNRLSTFLNSEELSENTMVGTSNNSFSVITFHRASFSWNQSGPVILKDINLSILPGELVAIIGAVGSGKSSLLCAILGEMFKVHGHLNVKSTLSYVSQKSWIQNNSVKENILFGLPFEKCLYQEVLEGCALKSEVEKMPGGDNSEIGENGVNLSGGQKQRISLARAVYNQADIYLLDDPLSALDNHIAEEIFNNVISKSGMLKEKIRLLVTYNMNYLSSVDRIIVLSNGSIVGLGTYDELCQQGVINPAFLQYLSKSLAKKGSVKPTYKVAPTYYSLKMNQGTEIIKSGLTSSCHECHVIRQQHIIHDEQAETGKVKWSLYWMLVQGLGWKQSVIILVFLLAYHAMFNVGNIWLANWNDDMLLNNFTSLPGNTTERHQRNSYYLSVYTVFGILQTLCAFVYMFLLQFRQISASRKFHTQLLHSIMNAPVRFFDSTPIGRILNRFGEDIVSVDYDIYSKANYTLNNALRCLATLIFISCIMPRFLIVVAVVVGVLYIIQIYSKVLKLLSQQLYIRSSCQLRRMASIQQSPIFIHFSETLSGISVIRAYQAQGRFIRDLFTKIDHFQGLRIASIAIARWFEARLDILSSVIIGASTIFAVVNRHSLSPGLVALIVTCSIRVNKEMSKFATIFGELENDVVSIERIQQFSKIENENSFIRNNLSTNDKDWLTTGSIQFIEYCASYGAGNGPVLRNVNFSIKGGEKIGIVGKTGAGKSSIALALFRFMEETSGSVLIDSVNIAHVNLKSLRNNLTILPQEPVLFTGTLRFNLDPRGEKTDSEIWKALELSHLKTCVEGLPNKLDYEVEEAGENLSMGQRQLLCLARTLLKKTKILILDEPTASIDLETEIVINKTIFSEFSQCTVLTITHRLNSVLHFDKILVMDEGQVVEFDTPQNLLSRPDSLFYSMSQNGFSVQNSEV